MPKLFGKLLSAETTIILAHVEKNPENFLDGIGPDALSFNPWSLLVDNGVFPWHERILIHLAIRKVKMAATKRKVYALLID